MRTDKQPIAQSKDDSSAADIGSRLQQLRQQKGLELQEVFKETHISTSNLRAIEDEMYDQLPADTFIRGQITIYGNFLGIDGNEAAKSFLQERDRQQPKGKKSRRGKTGHPLSPKKLAEPSNLSSATIAAILLLLIVVSFTAVCLYTGWNPFVSFLKHGRSSPSVSLSTKIRAPETKRSTTRQIQTPEPSLLPIQAYKKQPPQHNPPILPQSKQSIGGD